MYEEWYNKFWEEHKMSYKGKVFILNKPFKGSSKCCKKSNYGSKLEKHNEFFR